MMFEKEKKKSRMPCYYTLLFEYGMVLKGLEIALAWWRKCYNEDPEIYWNHNKSSKITHMTLQRFVKTLSGPSFGPPQLLDLWAWASTASSGKIPLGAPLVMNPSPNSSKILHMRKKTLGI
jgi:hypothetical protein